MFTLEDFNALPKEGKLAYVAAHGLFMNERKEDKYNIHSHQVHLFYVEIWYDYSQGFFPNNIKSYSNTEYALKQFETLSLDAQVELAWKDGQHIDSRMEVGFRIILFQLPTIYIELWYMPASHGVQSVKAFGFSDRLATYLDNIDISTVEDALNK